MDFPQGDRPRSQNCHDPCLVVVTAILILLSHNQSGFVLGFGIGSKLLSFIAANSEAKAACWRRVEVSLGWE